MILSQEFFERPTLKVARDLLGKYLVRWYGGRVTARRITEVEAYDGFKDRASHAHKGKTERNKIMFGPAGYWYVYLTYGMHWMLNIVTGREGYPAAILVRGVEGVNGPARVAKFFKIDKKINHKEAIRKTGLWIEDSGLKIKKSQINKSKRVGVDYAGPIWSNKQYRFYI